MTSLKLNLLAIAIVILTLSASFGFGVRLKQINGNDSNCDGNSYRCKNATHYNRCRTVARVGMQRLTVSGRRIFRCPLNKVCNDTGDYPCVIGESANLDAPVIISATVLNKNTTISNASAVIESDEEDTDDKEETVASNKPNVIENTAQVENIVTKPDILVGEATGSSAVGSTGSTGAGASSSTGIGATGSTAESTGGTGGASETGGSGTGGDYTGSGGSGGEYTETGEDGSGDGDEDEDEDEDGVECKFFSRQPDPDSCTQYTLCIAGRAISRECPADQAFWGSIRACSRNWANCPLIDECTQDGDLLPVPNSNDTSSYLICVAKRGGLFGGSQGNSDSDCRNSDFKVFKRQCSDDKVFDDTEKECVDSTSTSISTTTSTTTTAASTAKH